MTEAETAPLGRGALALAASAAGVAVATAWVTRVAEGRGALAESAAALDRGDTDAAIHAARAAAEARCPSCEAPAAAYARLEAIARASEARGDDASALAAFGAMRAAAVATRADRARRAQADAEIARLGQKIDATAALAGGAPSKAASEEQLRAVLARDAEARPGTATVALVGVGAALFVAGAMRLARAATLRRTDAGLALLGVAVAAVALALF